MNWPKQCSVRGFRGKVGHNMLLSKNGWAYPPLPKYDSQDNEYDVILDYDLDIQELDSAGKVKHTRILRAGIHYPITGVRHTQVGLDIMLVNGSVVSLPLEDITVICRVMSNSWTGTKDHSIAYQCNAANAKRRRQAVKDRERLYEFGIIGEQGGVKGKFMPLFLVDTAPPTENQYREANTVISDIERIYCSDPNLNSTAYIERVKAADRANAVA
jgi:hypothetical protein